MDSVQDKIRALHPLVNSLVNDVGLFTALEGILLFENKGKKDESVEQKKVNYRHLQTASEKMADREMDDIFEKDGSLREPPIRVTKIKKDPCLSERSSVYPLLKAVEEINPQVARAIAGKVNSIIVAAAIASHSKSQNVAYRKKIGLTYEESKDNLRTLQVDSFDTELIAFDLHKLRRFADNQKLEKDPAIDTEKLKRKNDALFDVMKKRQDYGVADCEFEAALLEKTVVTFSPIKDPTKASLVDVLLQDPEKAEKAVKSEAYLETDEFRALPSPMQSMIKQFMSGQQERPNKIIKVPGPIVALIEALVKKRMPEVQLTIHQLSRASTALMEQEPVNFAVGVDPTGELISFDESLDRNAIRMVLGPAKYELLRAEILTKLACLTCSKQSLESFRDVQSFPLQQRRQAKGSSGPIRKSHEGPKLLPRVYRLYENMIDSAELQPEVMPEVDRKERQMIAHRRLLPSGLLPSKSAVKEAKKNRYPTSAYPSEIMQRPETKRLRTPEGIGKLFAVTWIANGDQPEQLVQHRIDADRIIKMAADGQKDINTFIDELLSSHEGAALRFYTYVAESNPEHIKGQTRGWLGRALSRFSW